MRWVLCLIGLLVGGVSAQVAGAEAARPLMVAAAADLEFCLVSLNRVFRKAHPAVDVKVTTGSSGNLFAQIRNGAPYDVFLAADVAYPHKLMEDGDAVRGSLTPYAVGRVAVWTLKPGLDVKQGVRMLTDPAVGRVAIADPAHAPYGRAAKQALEHVGLWSQVRPKLVMGENISQTAQFVQAGGADAGIIALSLLLSPQLKGKGRFELIPESFHSRLMQAAVITKLGGNHPGSRDYLAFLKTPMARNVFISFGFVLPGE